MVPFAMLATSGTPSQYSMMSPDFSATHECTRRFRCGHLDQGPLYLLEEVFVGNIATILCDSKSKKGLLCDGIIQSFSVDTELFSSSVLEDFPRMLPLNSNSPHVSEGLQEILAVPQLVVGDQ